MFACHTIVHIRWPTETFAQARVDVKPMSISFTCTSSRNKAWVAAASSARLKFSAFRQLTMKRWCGVFIENLRHCQKAGTFRSFGERSGSDAFILFLPSIQECLQRPPSRPQTLQSTRFRSKVQSVDHISYSTALGRWRVADRALRVHLPLPGPPRMNLTLRSALFSLPQQV